MNRRILERKIAYLEQLVYERSTGRSGPSIAMNMWNYLMDHGPSTRDEIEAGLGPRYSNTPTINSYLNAGLITKNGNRYVANPDYNWDDVGVIRRDTPTSFADIRDRIVDTPEDPLDEAPVEQPTRRGRTTRASREPRQPTIKQSLFSRKFAEVKAAVDAGQNVNQVNDKGKTPLIYACGDPKGAAGESGQIVEYLLQHGADANDRDGNKPAIFVAISKANKPAIQSLVDHGANLGSSFKNELPLTYALNTKHIYDDTLIPLSKRMFSSGAFRQLIWAFCYGDISKKVFEDAVNNALSGNNPADSITRVNNNDIISCLDRGSSLLRDKYVELTGALPDYHNSNTFHATKQTLNTIYNDCVDAANGKLKIVNFGNYITVANAVADMLNKPKDFIFKPMTPDNIRESAKENRRNVYDLIDYAVMRNEPELLKVVADANIKDLDCNPILGNICGQMFYDSEYIPIVKQLCSIASNCRNLKSGISEYRLRDIKKSNNHYLVDWAIDQGLGKKMLEVPANVTPSDYSMQALAEAGFDVSQPTNTAQNLRNEYDTAKRDLLDFIKEDTWDRDMNRQLEKYPELLQDEDVLDAIDENDNLTTRQLKRRIDDLPKDVYDM